MSAELLNQIWLALYPIAAVSSQSVLDFSTVMMLITTAWLVRKNLQNFTFRWIGIEWAFLCYALVVVLGFFFNASSDAEWLRSMVKFSWLINIYILIFAFQSLKISCDLVLKILSVLSLGPTIYSMISYENGLDLITGRANIRITGLVNSSTYHAHGNAFIFIFMLGCLIFSFKRLSKTWQAISIVSILLLGLSILLTFTRGIWGSLFLSSFILLLYLNWKKMLKFALVSFVVFAVTLVAWPKFKDRVLSTANSDSDNQRLSLFMVNVQMWKEYPLLGIGYGENLRRNREYWDKPEWNKPEGYITSHAHNQYLNVLSTTGLCGFIFFCIFFFHFLIRNFKNLRQVNRSLEPEKFAILLICLWAQVQFVLACLTDVGFEYAKIRALILLVWALVIAIEQRPSLVKEPGHV